jgi:4-hydroxy-3-methylbut-2-enyl diphosphate reductase
MKPMEVMLASPRGFCAGVERAIEIVERALELRGAPIYVRHEIVHNKYVVETCARRARCSSRSSTRCPRRHGHLQRARRVEGRCARRPSGAASRCSTPPARWSRRCTSR